MNLEDIVKEINSINKMLYESTHTKFLYSICLYTTTENRMVIGRVLGWREGGGVGYGVVGRGLG